VKPLLELMELTPLADVTPGNVAANWCQRAALARALVLKPEMLLLDNPLRGLGARHVKWWMNFLEQLWRGHEWLGGKPMTLVATAEDLQPWRKMRAGSHCCGQAFQIDRFVGRGGVAGRHHHA